ncbi:MAG: rod shape-determining protein MreD [candidate division WOR-3 bacterium]
MRLLLICLIEYVLCLVQTSLGPFGPDLVLLSLFIIALHETRLAATALAFLAGLCLDLSVPASLGVNVAIYTALTYGVASVHALLYRSRWHLVLLVLVGLVARHGLRFLVGAELPAPTPLAVSGGLTLLLVLPADWLGSRLLQTRAT